VADSTLTTALVIKAINEASGTVAQVQNQLKGLRATAKSVFGGLALGGVGAGLGEFLKSDVGEAIKGQAENARVMTATISDGAAATKNMIAVQKMAIDTSSRMAVSEDTLKESYTLSRFAGLDNTAAQRAAIDSAKLSIGASKTLAEGQSQVAESARMVGASYQVFGDKLKDSRQQIDAISDSYALLQTRSNFANAAELNSALSEAVGTSKAYNVSLGQQNSLLETLANSGKFASMAGTAYTEVVAKLGAGNKKMLGFSYRSNGDVIAELGMIKAATEHMGVVQKEAWMAAHGFEMRSAAGLSLLLDKYPELIAAQKVYGTGAAGALGNLYNLRAGTAEDQIAIAQNNYNNFKEALGVTLIPTLTRAMRAASELFGVLRGFAEAHPIVAELAMGFLGISAALITVSGALQILGIGKTLTYAWSAATKILTAAQAALNLVMAANPVALAIIGVAALAVGAYELYRHWAGVKAFFQSIGPAIAGVFSSVVGAIAGDAAAMYNAGRHLAGELARGIKDAALAPVHAIAGIAASMRKFLPFSPAETGPLKDLHRVRIVETIAATMSPTPVIDAMRRVAAAAAIAVPIALATPALASIRPPAMRPASRPAFEMRGPGQSSAAAPVIHNTVNVTVNHRGGDDDIEDRVRAGVEKALERSGHKLAQVLERQRQTAQRLEY
jgi:TP901 family phage tail tape measure protein